MGEIRGRTDEENGVAIDEAGDGGDVHAVGGGRAGDEVGFDFEVGAGFAEGGVGGFGEDPEGAVLALLGSLLGTETYISGSVTPRSTYAFCLALRHAMRIDSVPPLVVTPAAPGGALNIARTIATISASIFLTPGNTSGCIGFATLNFSKASAWSLIKSLPP